MRVWSRVYQIDGKLRIFHGIQNCFVFFLHHFNIENGINPNIYQIVEKTYLCVRAWVRTRICLYFYVQLDSHIPHVNSNFNHSPLIMMIIE